MSNLNNSKFGKFLSSKGFYIALAVCIVGAGAAAWVALDTTMNSISDQDEKKLENPSPIASSQAAPQSSTPDWDFNGLQEAGRSVPDVKVEASDKEQAPDKKTEAAKSSSSSQSASSAAPKSASSSPESAGVLKPLGKQSGSGKQSSTAQPLAFSLPILSEVFAPYSGGELVKNKTLNDWRTHDGIDIKAEKGAEVMACADGQVSRLYDDALWGYCMEIEHSGGLTSVYCGLDKGSVTLKEGDAVSVKSAIGKVDKVPCEISLDPHLHFGLKQAGKWVDPVKTMGLN